jgi:hypothetical protein
MIISLSENLKTIMETVGNPIPSGWFEAIKKKKKLIWLVVSTHPRKKLIGQFGSSSQTSG